jgi:predicted PurR-regulated permease PerM
MSSTPGNEYFSEGGSFDLSIKLLLTSVILVWCAMIILPFATPVLWGVILAIAIHPLYRRLLKALKGRNGLSGTIITLILLALLIVPSVWLISSVVGSTKELITAVRDQTLEIPPPNPKVADWPLIGKPIDAAWQTLSTNFETAIITYREQILKIGEKFLGAIKSVASSFIMMLVSVLISGIILARSEKTEKPVLNIANRLFGKTGDEFVGMIALTIRNVAKGILGVAFIQFALIGATLILAKVPFAGLWALAALLLAIVQLPVGIVAIPVVIYLFTAREPLPAILWSVPIILFSLLDNILKPVLMGKGAPVPMLVIFLGAIGGMIMSGFVGLFTGAIVLSIGYKMVTTWASGGLKDTQTALSEKSD